MSSKSLSLSERKQRSIEDILRTADSVISIIYTPSKVERFKNACDNQYYPSYKRLMIQERDSTSGVFDILRGETLNGQKQISVRDIAKMANRVNPDPNKADISVFGLNSVALSPDLTQDVYNENPNIDSLAVYQKVKEDTSIFPFGPEKVIEIITKQSVSAPEKTPEFDNLNMRRT